MANDIDKHQQLIDMQRAFAELAKQAEAADAEMVAYLVEMALIQISEDIDAERERRDPVIR